MIIISLAITGCYRVDNTEDYPEEWGYQIESDEECPDISGTYSSLEPKEDKSKTVLANWLLCSTDTRNNLKIPEHNAIEINQISSEEFNIKLLKNSDFVSEYQLMKNNNEFNCTRDKKIEILCKETEDMYYSGYYKSKAFFSINNEKFLILNVKSFGIGALLKIVPTTIKKSRYYRYRSIVETKIID